jgi:hypothetical protein
VTGLRSATSPLRALWLGLLAILLGLRLVGSTGYMPGMDHGSLTVIVCPNADENAPLALGAAHHHHHHHGKTEHHHGTCPYAAASAVGALGADFGPLLAVLILATALLLGRSFLFLERSNARERPPTRAPPIPA